MCSGGTGPHHKGALPHNGSVLNWTENDRFQAAEAVVVERAHEFLYAHGGIDYRCLHFVGAAVGGPLGSAPVAGESASTCAAKLRYLAFNPNATSSNGTVMYGARVAGRGYNDSTVAAAVAVFLLVRREHFWFASLAQPNMSAVMVRNLLGRDYGAPTGPMRELPLPSPSDESTSDGVPSSSSSLVFERRYERATVRLDCSGFSATFLEHAGPEGSLSVSGGRGHGSTRRD